MKEKENLISFKIAKLAKEKGFDWEVEKGYFSNGVLSNTWTAIHIEISSQILKAVSDKLFNKTVYMASTQSLLQKWLREKYNIDVEPYLILYYGEEAEKPQTINEKEYTYKILNQGINEFVKTRYKNYEKALEKGLFEALKLIKNV